MSFNELIDGNLPKRSDNYRNRSADIVTNLDQVKDDSLKELLKFYCGLEKTKCGAPLRQSFSPMNFPQHLEYMSLLKFEGGDKGNLNNYKYKVFGSAFVHFYGGDVTKLSPMQLPSKSLRRRCEDHLPSILAHPKPYVAISELVLVDHDFIISESLALPFSSDGVEADYLLTEIRFTHHSKDGKIIKKFTF